MLRHGACGVRCVFTVQDTEGGYMQIYDNDLRYKQIQNKMVNMPQWAKAEHMEMSVPEKELWRYSGDRIKVRKEHMKMIDLGKELLKSSEGDSYSSARLGKGRIALL